MIKQERIIDRITKEVEMLNQHFNNYEQIKKFELMGAQWSMDTGELTPTLKLKRKKIMEKYKGLYQKMYA